MLLTWCFHWFSDFRSNFRPCYNVSQLYVGKPFIQKALKNTLFPCLLFFPQVTILVSWSIDCTNGSELTMMLQKHQQGEIRSRSSIFSEFVMRRRQLLGVTIMPVGLLRVTDLQPRSPRDGGCCVTGARQHYPTLQGQGTRDYGVLSLQMWQIRCDMSVRAQEHRPLSLILVYYFFCFCSFPWYTNTPTHWNRHIHPKKRSSLCLPHKSRHRNTNTLKQGNIVTHSCMNTHTRRYTHSTPPVAVIKSSHSALHCVKVTACLYFSLSTVFSFPDVHSSSPLRCLPVIPCHPTSPTPLLPAESYR